MAIPLAPRIVVDPAIRFGKPVIEGTRVPVELVVAKLAGGMTVQEVAEEYGITPEDVRAALGYAAKLLADSELSPPDRSLAKVSGASTATTRSGRRPPGYES